MDQSVELLVGEVGAFVVAGKPFGLIVLDTSSSMQEKRVGTVKGFNAFVERQVVDNPHLVLAVLGFDTKLRMLVPPTPIARVPQFTMATYDPKGSGTRLLDALGHTMRRLDRFFEALGVSGRPAKFTLGIITDGQDRDSHRYTKETIQGLLIERQERGWNVLYLGVGFDAFAEAAAMGVRADHTMTFTGTDDGATDSFASMSMSMTDLSRGGSGAVDSSSS